MTTHWWLVAGSAAVALYLVNKRENSLLEKNNEEFRTGFTAGFLTPGPFTILAIVGIFAVR